MDVLILVLSVIASIGLTALAVYKLVTKGFSKDTLATIVDELIVTIDLFKASTSTETRKEVLKDLGKRLEEKDLKKELDELVAKLGLSEKV